MYYLIVLEARSVKSVSLGSQQGIGGGCAPSRGPRGEFLPCLLWPLAYDHITQISVSLITLPSPLLCIKPAFASFLQGHLCWAVAITQKTQGNLASRDPKWHLQSLCHIR